MLTAAIIFNIVFALINLALFIYNVKTGKRFYATTSFCGFIIHVSVTVILLN